MNTATRGFDLNNGDYGSLVIDNLKNNEMVVSNPNNANYATSITIQLPKSEELTPIDLNGLIIKGAPIQAFNEQNNQNWTQGTVIPDVEIPWDSPLWTTVQKPNQNMRAFSFSEIPIQPNSTAIIVEEPEDDEPNNNPDSDNEEKDKRITVISNNNVNPIIVKTVNTVKYILAEAVPILAGIAGVVVPGCSVVVKVWSAWNSMKEKLGFTVAPTVNSDAVASLIEWYADTDLGDRDVKMRDGEPSDEPSDEPSNDEPSSPTVIELPDFDKPFGLVLDGSLYKFRTSSN